MSRLPEVDIENLNPDQEAFRDQIVASPRGELRGPFVPLLHHPAVGNLIQKVGAQLRFEGVLAGNLRELAIIITARHWTAQYEWHAHRRIGEKEGISPHICDAIAERREPAFDNEQEKLVYKFVTGMLANDLRTPDHVFSEALREFGPNGVIELNCLCGFYGLIGSVLNNFDVEIPDGNDKTPLPA
ncbi:MAG: hypothetical protein CMM41_06080 [Rhodospirillaceae bacterium]|nr:hypothetical protein [Rhodospirillaceae bacterium]|tara:strand:+ start:1821 stop:2378 length:558 start_codon:yes stop_codon:yes gene_type:complete